MPRPRAKGSRLHAGAGSTLLHALIIALMVHSTSRAAAGPPPDTRRERIVLHPPADAEPVPPVHAEHRRGASTRARTVISPGRPIPHVDLSRTTPVFPADISMLGPDPAAEAARMFARGSGGGGQAAHPGDGAPDGVHTLAGVDRGARLAPGTSSPIYPEALRRMGVEGGVVVRFVVDTAGRAEPGSHAFVTATHPAFAAAVEGALPRLRFLPAEVGGRRVRQLVEMPFTFRLDR